MSYTFARKSTKSRIMFVTTRVKKVKIARIVVALIKNSDSKIIRATDIRSCIMVDPFLYVTTHPRRNVCLNQAKLREQF